MAPPVAEGTTVARAFARALRAAGVQRAYGLPGEDHLRVLDALVAEGIAYVPAREESAAALMAATEAQATGIPGVVVVTLAPGLTNAINGMAHASLDGIPLLVVCGQHHPERAPLIVRQSMDNPQLAAGVTKWRVTASARIHQVLARALDTALAPPRGPVLFELRDDIAILPAMDHLHDWPMLQASARTTVVPGAADADLPARLSAAERPVIVVGGNCPVDARARSAIACAAAAVRAPVFTSPSAMGVVARHDPWFAGTFMNGNLEAEVIGNSDLVLTLGLDARDFFNGPWRYAAPVISVDAYPDTQRFLPTEHQLLGDTAAILAPLSHARSCSRWSLDSVIAYRARVNAPFDPADTHAFTIASALRSARSIAPDDALVAVDAGFGKPLTSYLWSAAEPNQYFTAHGLSTMGYALPAANALQLAFPERKVLAFMGDGSLLMRASEITVAVEHGLAPVYVAWMDGSLAQIETKQLRQHLRPVGARLPAISCVRVAEAFGGVGVDATSLEEFETALEAALRGDAPTLIGAYVDQSHRARWYELMRG